MLLTDEDGDTLEVKEVFGFGKPRLLVRVTQEGVEAQMNLDRRQVVALLDTLNAFAQAVEDEDE